MQPLIVVTIADDNYVLGLAVTVRSMLDHLDPAQPVELYVLGGMGEENQRRLAASWADRDVTPHYAALTPEEVDGLPRVELFLSTVVPYYRLLVSQIVAPEHGGRIVWLDSDLLVLADVTKMLQEPALDDHVVVAARDLGMPTVRNGVLRWETLGIDPELPYMNVGVMAIDLDRWRADDPGPTMFEYLRTYADEVVFLDQDALNVHFAGRFGALDPRWNAIHLTWEPQGAMSLGDQAIEAVRADPWIVHYTSYDKPWRWGCAHPFTDQWFSVLDRTSWAGWRPPAPPPPPTLTKRVRKRATKELDKAKARVLTKLGRGPAADPEASAEATTTSAA